MAEQGYELMHKDDVVASLQLDDLPGAILKVIPGTNPELLPLGGASAHVPSPSVRGTLPRSCSRRASHPRKAYSCETSVSACLTTIGSDCKKAT